MSCETATKQQLIVLVTYPILHANFLILFEEWNYQNILKILCENDVIVLSVVSNFLLITIFSDYL